MKTIVDVQNALRRGYEMLRATPEGIEGKMDEGCCRVLYSPIWDDDGSASFHDPVRLMVYSYALGPSRQHFFKRGKTDRQINYYTWESPDIFAKAVEVIEGWIEEWQSVESEMME